LWHDESVPYIERVEPVIHARDVGVALQFYASLGFSERFRDDVDSPTFALVRRDDAVIALQWHDFLGVSGDRPNLRFPVRDIVDLSQELSSLDDRTPLIDTAWGTREFHVRDPDGNGLQFYCDL
jgi:hypothetical protein